MPALTAHQSQSMPGLRRVLGGWGTRGAGASRSLLLTAGLALTLALPLELLLLRAGPPLLLLLLLLVLLLRMLLLVLLLLVMLERVPL